MGSTPYAKMGNLIAEQSLKILQAGCEHERASIAGEKVTDSFTAEMAHKSGVEHIARLATRRHQKPEHGTLTIYRRP
jgi:hypothetical protein